MGIGFFLSLFMVIIYFALITKFPGLRPKRHYTRERNNIHIHIHPERKSPQNRGSPNDPIRNLGDTEKNIRDYRERVEKQTRKNGIFDNWGYLKKKKK